MRMYGFLKTPYLTNRKDLICKVMLHETRRQGTFAYLYTSPEALFSSFDLHYAELEDALEDELGPGQAVSVSVQQAAPAQEEPPVQPGPPAQEAAPIQEAAPVQQAAPAQEEPHVFAVPKSPGYINVMQVLVEEKAPKYIKMFGLCQCDRCLEDVKALTLNHLPSKYVVLEHGDMIPRLTVYEGKFSSDITAQLLQACKIVMETPHHSR